MLSAVLGCCGGRWEVNLNDYQQAAQRTAKPLPDTTLREHMAVMALGLAGEAGEVADLIKKHIGHGHHLDIKKVRGEIGDCLWYAAALAAVCGLSLEEVAATNLLKLEIRYPSGFSAEASMNRPAELDKEPG